MKTYNYLEPGDILYSSSGYDQTNIDFYKVVKLAGKTMVEVVPIESKLVPGQPDEYTDLVMPYPANEGKPFRRKIKGKERPYINIEYWNCAFPWDVKPKQQPNMHYGH